MKKDKTKISEKTVMAVRKTMTALGFESCPFIIPEIENDDSEKKNSGSCNIFSRKIYINIDLVERFTLLHEVTHSQQIHENKVGYRKAGGDIDRKLYRLDVSEQQANIVAGVITGIISYREINYIGYIVKNSDDILLICQTIINNRRHNRNDLENWFLNRYDLKKNLTRSGRVRFNKLFKKGEIKK